MNLGQGLMLFSDVVADLESNGIIKSDGTIVFPTDATPYEVLAAKVNTQLVSYGVTEPSEVQSIIGMLPGIMLMLGIK